MGDILQEIIHFGGSLVEERRCEKQSVNSITGRHAFQAMWKRGEGKEPLQKR